MKADACTIEYRGFGAGGLLMAFVTGAVAGVAAAYYTAGHTADENRERLRQVSEGTRVALGRLPDALKKAGEAAREALSQAIAAQADDPIQAEDESPFRTFRSSAGG